MSAQPSLELTLKDKIQLKSFQLHKERYFSMTIKSYLVDAI